MILRASHLALILFIAIIVTVTTTVSADENASTIKILSYQRIDEDRYPETNIRLEQFQAHIEELLKSDSNVISPNDLIAHIEGQKLLPEHSVLISFDGGYRSAFEKALPILEKAQLPYLFNFAPSTLKRKHGPFITPNMLRKLNKNPLATLGLHTHEYERIEDLEEQKIRHAINHAKSDFKDLTGHDAQFFTYPFGELSKTYKHVVQNSGFELAFALNSQPVSIEPQNQSFDKQRFALPRFAMTEGYANIDRLRMILSLKALPVSDVTPTDLRLYTTQPVFGFSVDKQDLFPEQLQCFLSDRGRVDLIFITDTRVQIKLNTPLQGERIRLNCTYFENIKGQTKAQWYWFGRLFTLPQVGLQPLPE